MEYQNEENRSSQENRSNQENSSFMEELGLNEQKSPMTLQEWCKDETGIGVVEVILILVVLIGLVIIFQTQIKSIVSTIFSTISSGITNIKVK